jgi:hypothetical protein
MEELKKTLSLGTIKNGAAIEVLDEELKKVLANIQDENTNPTGIREVSFKLKIKPNQERTNFVYSVEVASKVCPIKGIDGTGFLHSKGNNLEAYEHNPEQMTFFQDLNKKTEPKVVNNGSD